MQSVKNNRHTLVEKWWHSSSGAQQLRVANEWSGGLKPTVFHKALQVNSETASEGVGEGTGRDGEAQSDEVEHRRYGYKDPVIQVLHRPTVHAYLGDHRGTYRVEKTQEEWNIITQYFSSSRVDVCLHHYRQVPVVPHKNTVSKTDRLRVGQRKERLPSD